MLIYTNVKDLSNCENVMDIVRCKMHYIPDNIYNLASQNPDVIITNYNVQKACKEFPTTQFIYIGDEECSFPAIKSEHNYKLDWGFDSLECLQFMDVESSMENVFINKGGHETKYSVQKLKSQYPNIHIYGHAFGVHGINDNVLNDSYIISQYKTIFSNDNKVLQKSLFMKRETNILNTKGNIYELSSVVDKDVSNSTNFDKMADILNNSYPEISQQLLEMKEKIHATN